MSLLRNSASKYLILLVLTTVIAGCAGGLSRLNTAQSIAQDAGLNGKKVTSGRWTFQVFQRPGIARADTVHVYLEGDGFAYVRGGRVNFLDPSPRNPIALRLAALDPRSGVIYIARPCTYLTSVQRSQECSYLDWTELRFSQEVVDAVSAVIDAAKRGDDQGVSLAGFSGGGVLAAAIAANRDDVVDLTTLGSPLSLKVWREVEGFKSSLSYSDIQPSENEEIDEEDPRVFLLAPLALSVDPASEARNLSRIPQRHYVGEDDDIVQWEVVRRFARAFPTGQRPDIYKLPNVDHDCCWEDIWPELLGQRIRPPANP